MLQKQLGARGRCCTARSTRPPPSESASPQPCAGGRLVPALLYLHINVVPGRDGALACAPRRQRAPAYPLDRSRAGGAPRSRSVAVGIVVLPAACPHAASARREAGVARADALASTACPSTGCTLPVTRRCSSAPPRRRRFCVLRTVGEEAGTAPHSPSHAHAWRLKTRPARSRRFAHRRLPEAQFPARRVRAASYATTEKPHRL